MGTGEFEELLGQRVCLVHATDEEQGLVQLGEHKRLGEHVAPSSNALQHLIQEQKGLSSAPVKGIRRPQREAVTGRKSREYWESARLRSSTGIAL